MRKAELSLTDEERKIAQEVFDNSGGIQGLESVRGALHCIGQFITDRELKSVCGQVGYSGSGYLIAQQFIDLVCHLKARHLEKMSDNDYETIEVFNAMFTQEELDPSTGQPTVSVQESRINDIFNEFELSVDVSSFIHGKSVGDGLSEREYDIDDFRSLFKNVYKREGPTATRQKQRRVTMDEKAISLSPSVASIAVKNRPPSLSVKDTLSKKKDDGRPTLLDNEWPRRRSSKELLFPTRRESSMYAPMFTRSKAHMMHSNLSLKGTKDNENIEVPPLYIPAKGSPSPSDKKQFSVALHCYDTFAEAARHNQQGSNIGNIEELQFLLDRVRRENDSHMKRREEAKQIKRQKRYILQRTNDQSLDILAASVAAKFSKEPRVERARPKQEERETVKLVSVQALSHPEEPKRVLKRHLYRIVQPSPFKSQKPRLGAEHAYDQEQALRSMYELTHDVSLPSAEDTTWEVISMNRADKRSTQRSASKSRLPPCTVSGEHFDEIPWDVIEDE